MEGLRYGKKKRKKGRFLCTFLLLLVASAGIFFYTEREEEKEDDPNARENVVLQDGQRWLTLKIDTIAGNEIQAAEIEGAQSGSQWESAANAEDAEDGPQRERAANAENAEGGSRREDTEDDSQRESAENAESGSRRKGEENTEDTESGPLQTWQIPVGTEVVTKLGSVTTFSRLAAGDVICCLTERTDGGDVILKIWIEE